MATHYAAGGALRPVIKETTKRSKNSRNRTLAISVEVPAIPPKPNMAAIIAIIKNVTDQFSIRILPSFFSWVDHNNSLVYLKLLHKLHIHTLESAVCFLPYPTSYVF
jgi:hypothetical protein